MTTNKNNNPNNADLTYYYSYLFLQDKANDVLANQLKNLAKNGFKVAIKTHFVRLYNNQESIYKAYFDIILDDKIIVSVPFNYEFKEKSNHNHALKDETITLNKDFENTLKEISKYLQIPIIIQTNKLIKLFNKNQNNISNKQIDNSNQVYVCTSLSINHGIFSMNNRNRNLLSNDLLVWKYQNDTLSFSFINGYNLCVYLAKGNELENIQFKNTIKNAKDFVKINYYITNNKIKTQITTNKIYKNPINASYKDYIKDNYCENTLNYLNLEIVLKDELDINKIFNDFYNDFKDQIVLKKQVAKHLE